jgi:hypothetical protein
MLELVRLFLFAHSMHSERHDMWERTAIWSSAEGGVGMAGHSLDVLRKSMELVGVIFVALAKLCHVTIQI